MLAGLRFIIGACFEVVPHIERVLFSVYEGALQAYRAISISKLHPLLDFHT